MDSVFICNNCGWQGHESELETDSVETCMGNDQIEVCPQCGSMDVVKKQ
jgi:predicted RNA-binding Zn-ribbon protein involved in translation (DUF1610 family)